MSPCLSARCVDVLREAAAHRKKADLVFPSLRGKVLSDATMGKLLREHGIDAVPHGFRSSFRDDGAAWAAAAPNIAQNAAQGVSRCV